MTQLFHGGDESEKIPSPNREPLCTYSGILYSGYSMCQSLELGFFMRSCGCNAKAQDILVLGEPRWSAHKRPPNLARVGLTTLEINKS